MLIAISQKQDKNKWGEFIDSLENNYINYLEKFGIKLIPIPNSSKNILSYFKKFPISAIILSGGNDVNPELYGEEIKEGFSISKQRDETEKKLLEIAVKKKIPVLGICRGMQFINTYFNGKLEKVEEHTRKNHKIKITGETKDVLGDEIEVNSYHNYGISKNTLSNKLNSFANAEGIVEGIFHPFFPIGGIQWHPERDSPNKEANRKLIDAFINKKLFWKK